MLEPRLNSSASAQLIVTEADLASALRFERGDDFPPVFATARMVALMEVAAARCLIPHLQEGDRMMRGKLVAELTSARSCQPPGSSPVR